MVGSYRASRFSLEVIAGLVFGLLAAGLLVAASDVETKYKLATVAAVAGFAALAAFPERRVACVALWVFIHPLSVEKIFYLNASEGPQFTDPTMAINASDGPLALLALFLLVETMVSNRLAFRWSRLTTILLAFLVWSAVSFAIHATYFDDGLVTSAPIAILQNVRMLVFVLLIQSAIRTRGDVIVVLLAVGVAVLLQTLIVGLSYSAGRVFSYGATTVDEGLATLQGFDSSGSSQLLRATGTMGQVNEQATFHAYMTIPLLAFFAARNGLIRFVSLVTVACSALALILTFSRGAWMAFPVGLAVCAGLALHHNLIQRTAILIGAICTVGGAVALLFLAQPIYERLAYGDTGATASRLRMLVVAADLFQSFPVIGVGPGEFAEAALRLYPTEFDEQQWVEPGDKLPYPSPTIGRVDIEEARAGGFYLRRPLPVHNRFMLVLSELGLPGILLWLWFYVEFIRQSWQCSKSADRFLCLLGSAGVGLAAAELAYMMVEHFQVDKTLQVMLFGPALMFAASRVAGISPYWTPSTSQSAHL